MKRNRFILFPIYVVIAALLYSCQTDNYAAPDGTITGSVIDKITGKPIITEQPNGFRIKLEEISWSDAPVPQYFWGKADGTFNYTKLFAATFKVTPVEGAFVTPDPQTVEIKSRGVTKVDFTVTPYISFSNVSIVKTGTNITATFTLTKQVATATPQDYRVFATYKTPLVGVTVFDANVFTNPQLVSGPIALKDADFGKPLVVTLDNLVAGKLYYVRVGARCSNASSRYNMTEVVSIQM